MSTTSNHNCMENNCDGKKNHELNLTCNYCSSSWYFDCIESKSEIKSLLSLLKCVEDMLPNDVLDIDSTINSLFNIDSVFLFVCPTCKSNDSYTAMKVKLNSKISTLKAEKKKISEDNFTLTESLNIERENVLQLTSRLDAKSIPSGSTSVISSPVTSIQQIADVDRRLKIVENFVSGFNKNDNTTTNIRDSVNNNDVAEIYEIYVSKFPPTTTCDDIVQRIVDKLKLNRGVFDVTRLLRHKANIKKLSFVSFKVSTLNKEVFESIIDKNIWSPQYNVSKFVPKLNPNKKINTKKSAKTSNMKINNVKKKIKNINNEILHNKKKNDKHCILNVQQMTDLEPTHSNNDNKNQSKSIFNNNNNRRYNHTISHQSHNSITPPTMMNNYMYPVNQNNHNGYQNFWQMQSYHHPNLLYQNHMIHPSMQLQPMLYGGIPMNYQH